MNDLSNKFLDYLNGSLGEVEEQKLFTTMAYDNDVRDEFRSFEIEVTNTVNNEDVELHSILAILELGSTSMEN